MNAGHSAAWDQRWAEAAEAYQRALQEFPEHTGALAGLGLALSELGRYEEALEVYRKAAQVSPNDPVPLEKVGLLSGRTGKIQEAIAAFLKAAELYIKSQEVQKAIQCLTSIVQLDSNHLAAHSYLAMIHERLGHKTQAIHEYLASASLFQRSGNAEKAAEMIGRALRLDPSSTEARQAQKMLASGQLLPKPIRPHGGTAPLIMAQVKAMEKPQSAEETEKQDPVTAAYRKSLTVIAGLLFELSEESEGGSAGRRGAMQALMRGTGPLNVKQSDRLKIMLHISQAIDAQTRGDQALAAEEFERATEAGFKNAAVYFCLGYLRANSERYESGLRHLQFSVQHQEYALASRLLMGQIHRRLGRIKEAVVDYLEALKIADCESVLSSQKNELALLYEPIIEAQKQVEDVAEQEKLCDNIHALLMHPDWRQQVKQAREQLPKTAPNAPALPLAEIMANAQSSQVIEIIGRVHSLAKAGFLRTAMDEAFEALKYAPTYLPLHTLIGDLLIQEGRNQDAINKYSVVAQAYRTRGDVQSAIELMRRILHLSPMDLNLRTSLVELLTARGAIDEAIAEYMDIADIYYRLAELDMARKTYAAGLRLAQQGEASRAWSIKLLQRMADIDMQRLDWKQAARVYEQIRTLQPEDENVRKQLVNLNLRLGDIQKATAELDNFLTYLQSNGQRHKAIRFLEELLEENPKHPVLLRALAEEYRLADRVQDAVNQLDTLGELLLQAGDRAGAIQAVEAIIAIRPPNVAEYITLLKQLEGEG
ncbi:MAG: tetratricopeptide repeat protein [Anaerolineales bacterium]|nr:tetratricopeptide repeat protein [Anaerolineales bacterium]MCX7608887.1 tetratricopeptide repeat protein [Anaerolineales bacterium]